MSKGAGEIGDDLRQYYPIRGDINHLTYLEDREYSVFGVCTSSSHLDT
jgi:hypothetical protein